MREWIHARATDALESFWQQWTWSSQTSKVGLHLAGFGKCSRLPCCLHLLREVLSSHM
jgi:hypothetical protein